MRTHNVKSRRRRSSRNGSDSSKNSHSCSVEGCRRIEGKCCYRTHRHIKKCWCCDAASKQSRQQQQEQQEELQEEQQQRRRELEGRVGEECDKSDLCMRQQRRKRDVIRAMFPVLMHMLLSPLLVCCNKLLFNRSRVWGVPLAISLLQQAVAVGLLVLFQCLYTSRKRCSTTGADTSHLLRVCHRLFSSFRPLEAAKQQQQQPQENKAQSFFSAEQQQHASSAGLEEVTEDEKHQKHYYHVPSPQQQQQQQQQQQKHHEQQERQQQQKQQEHQQQPRGQRELKEQQEHKQQQGQQEQQEQQLGLVQCFKGRQQRVCIRSQQQLLPQRAQSLCAGPHCIEGEEEETAAYEWPLGQQKIENFCSSNEKERVQQHQQSGDVSAFCTSDEERDELQEYYEQEDAPPPHSSSEVLCHMEQSKVFSREMFFACAPVVVPFTLMICCANRCLYSTELTGYHVARCVAIPLQLVLEIIDNNTRSSHMASNRHTYHNNNQKARHNENNIIGIERSDSHITCDNHSRSNSSTRSAGAPSIRWNSTQGRGGDGEGGEGGGEGRRNDKSSTIGRNTRVDMDCACARCRTGVCTQSSKNHGGSNKDKSKIGSSSSDSNRLVLRTRSCKLNTPRICRQRTCSESSNRRRSICRAAVGVEEASAISSSCRHGGCSRRICISACRCCSRSSSGHSRNLSRGDGFRGIVENGSLKCDSHCGVHKRRMPRGDYNCLSYRSRTHRDSNTGSCCTETTCWNVEKKMFKHSKSRATLRGGVTWLSIFIRSIFHLVSSVFLSLWQWYSTRGSAAKQCYGRKCRGEGVRTGSWQTQKKRISHRHSPLSRDSSVQQEQRTQGNLLQVDTQHKLHGGSHQRCDRVREKEEAGEEEDEQQQQMKQEHHKRFERVREEEEAGEEEDAQQQQMKQEQRGVVGRGPLRMVQEREQRESILCALVLGFRPLLSLDGLSRLLFPSLLLRRLDQLEVTRRRLAACACISGGFALAAGYGQQLSVEGLVTGVVASFFGALHMKAAGCVLTRAREQQQRQLQRHQLKQQQMWKVTQHRDCLKKLSKEDKSQQQLLYHSHEQQLLLMARNDGHCSSGIGGGSQGVNAISLLQQHESHRNQQLSPQLQQRSEHQEDQEEQHQQQREHEGPIQQKYEGKHQHIEKHQQQLESQETRQQGQSQSASLSLHQPKLRKLATPDCWQKKGGRLESSVAEQKQRASLGQLQRHTQKFRAMQSGSCNADSVQLAVTLHAGAAAVLLLIPLACIELYLVNWGFVSVRTSNSQEAGTLSLGTAYHHTPATWFNVSTRAEGNHEAMRKAQVAPLEYSDNSANLHHAPALSAISQQRREHDSQTPPLPDSLFPFERSDLWELIVAATAAVPTSAALLLLASGLLAALLPLSSYFCFDRLSPLSCCILGFFKSCCQMLLCPLVVGEAPFPAPAAAVACTVSLCGCALYAYDSYASMKRSIPYRSRPFDCEKA